jgi:hypothetical protein
MGMIVESKYPDFDGFCVGDRVRLRDHVVKRASAEEARTPPCVTGEIVAILDRGVLVKHDDGSGPFGWARTEVLVYRRDESGQEAKVEAEPSPVWSGDQEMT